MGRNRNARRKQQPDADNNEQSQASSLLIDFEYSDPPVENAPTYVGGLNDAENVGRHVGSYGEGELYADEPGSFYGAQDYAEPFALSGISQ